MGDCEGIPYVGRAAALAFGSPTAEGTLVKRLPSSVAFVPLLSLLACVWTTAPKETLPETLTGRAGSLGLQTRLLLTTSHVTMSSFSPNSFSPERASSALARVCSSSAGTSKLTVSFSSGEDANRLSTFV